MKKTYAILLGFTAILLAATAAYFSIFGLSKLFIGASLSIVIMAATLEFSKIVAVTYLHQYWKKITLAIKAYLVTGVVVLMIITSVGIYGFLSSAYSRVSIELDKMSGDTELLDKKIEIKEGEKEHLNEQIQTRNNRIASLTELRTGQESRLDTLYMRGWIAAARTTEGVIKDANENIALLYGEIQDINLKVEAVNDSIYKYETQKLDISNSDISGEIGPLRYISDLTGADMSKVVNWLILMLIVVFDPMAVALIISASGMVKMIREDKENLLRKKNIEDIDVNIGKTQPLPKKTNSFDNAEYISNKTGDFELVNPKKTIIDDVVNDGVNDGVNNEVVDEVVGGKIDDEIDEGANEGVNEGANEGVNDVVSNEVIEETISEVDGGINDEIDESVNNEIDEDADKNISGEIEGGVEREANSNDVFIDESSFEDLQVDSNMNSEYDFVEGIDDFQELENFNEDIDPVVDLPFPEEYTYPSVETEKVFVDSTHKPTLYSKLLDVFYDNGANKSGDELPKYAIFKDSVDREYTGISEKDIKDFLLICNLFKITEFKNKKGYFEKNYHDAKNLILKI